MSSKKKKRCLSKKKCRPFSSSSFFRTLFVRSLKKNDDRMEDLEEKERGGGKREARE